MIDFALGLVETKGLVGAIEAADAMVKTSNVKLIARERTDPAMFTIKIIGDTAAVRSAVDAGASAAQRLNQLLSKHIIPRPADGMESIVFAKSFLSEDEIAELLGNTINTSPAPQIAEKELEIVQELPLQSQQLFSESSEKDLYRNELSAMTVHQLRNYARGVEGLSIFGRQISKANKEELITELLQARFDR